MTDSKPTEAPKNETGRARGPLLGKIGIALILLSGVFFFTMLAVPFMPLGAGSKVIIGGSLFAGVQIAWWVGAALAGPAVVAKIYRLFRRPSKTPEADAAAKGE